MKFFVPDARDEEAAEKVYEANVKDVGGVAVKERIWKLRWKHNGMDMEAEVGKPLDPYYGTRQEPVLAIIDCGQWHSVCTMSRVARADPVLADKGHPGTYVTHFDKEEV